MELDPRTDAQRRRVLARLVRWIDHQDLAKSMQRVTEASARSLGVARVGVWLFDEERIRLRCVDLYDVALRTHTAGTEITAARYPNYFDALIAERALAAGDALADARTRELAEGYLLPLGITAMLDVPLWVGGHMVGVLCHEHVGTGPRAWSAGDEAFAASLGDLTALAIESCERHRVAEARSEREATLLGDVLRAAEEALAALPADSPARPALERVRTTAERGLAFARRTVARAA